MRIAFAVYGSLELVSGGNVYDRALVRALEALGHGVDVRSLPWNGYARAVATSLGPWTVDWERWRDAVPDVIIEDELVHPSLFCRGRRPSWRGSTTTIARIALVHNLKCRQPRERFASAKTMVERRYLASVDGVIAVCESTLCDVREVVGREAPALVAHAGRDHVFPDVDDAIIDRRSREAGPLRILHAAAIVPHKGLARLLGALARDARFDFRLDVVGDTEKNRAYARDVRTLIRTLGLAERVHLHGEQREADLRDFYRRGHVLVLPSDREAYSLAGLEALGFGLPVLATADGGMGEMLRDGDCGDLLDPDDGKAWVRRLEALSIDRTQLARRGRAARARYLEHRTWHEVAISVERFLKEIVDRRRAPSPG